MVFDTTDDKGKKVPLRDRARLGIKPNRQTLMIRLDAWRDGDIESLLQLFAHDAAKKAKTVAFARSKEETATEADRKARADSACATHTHTLTSQHRTFNSNPPFIFTGRKNH